MIDFIVDVMTEEPFEGCRYCRLNEDLYLVFAWCEGEDEEPSLCGKIALNCDDLQCDYDWDWIMPKVEGITIDTELTDCQDLPIEGVCDFFMEKYDEITNYDDEDENDL